MLSKNQVVAVRKAIEMTYTGTCNIIERQKVSKPNKSTGFKEVIVIENQPCKLSFSSLASSKNGENASKIVQSVKVLIAPEIHVKPGSKLTITQNGITTDYTNSGKPATYSTHQEIGLELHDGWI